MPGIYRTPTGFRVIASIGRGQRVEKAFPKGTSVRAMQRWQEDARRDLRHRPRLVTGSLGADVATYLAARATMPTAKERAQHLQLWVEALGASRARETVTAIEVRAVLERWLGTGLQPGTVNRRRTALQSFYTVLNGPDGANPVRGVPKLREAVPLPKRLDYATVEAILAHMPDVTQTQPGEPRDVGSRTKARLRVLAYTGLPHAQIARLRPGDLHAAERLLYVKGRSKGAGTSDLWLPLSARGLSAVQELFALGAVGPFSQSSMRMSFRRAAQKVGRPDLTPYDLRHLFGTTLLRLTRNRAATRDLMLHRSDRTTARYVAAEIPAELRHALALFDADVVEAGCGTSADERGVEGPIH